MTEPHRHASHPAIATPLQAVERAVAKAKRALIHFHIDHCLTDGHGHDMAQIKALTKFL